MELSYVSVGAFCLVAGIITGCLLSAEFYRRRFAREWLELQKTRTE